MSTREDVKDHRTDITYLYMIDCAWKPGGMGEQFPCKKYQEVKVIGIEEPNSSIKFEFVNEPGVVYQCFYGWAFLENTPEALVKLEEYKKVSAELGRVRELHQKVSRSLPTLCIHTESGDAKEEVMHHQV